MRKIVGWLVVLVGTACLASPLPSLETSAWEAGLHWTWEMDPVQTSPYRIHAYLLKVERLLDYEVGMVAFVTEFAGPLAGLTRV